MITTNGFLTALECTKCVFGRGSAPDPTGGAYSTLPDPLAALRGPTSKGEGRGRKGVKETGRGKEGKGRGREVPAPLLQISGSAPDDGYLQKKNMTKMANSC